jgi:hypothetical protein
LPLESSNISSILVERGWKLGGHQVNLNAVHPDVLFDSQGITIVQSNTSLLLLKYINPYPANVEKMVNSY